MKNADYDKYYINEIDYKRPYPGFCNFFINYAPKGKVLDLGCGFGKDSLFLGKLGYSVRSIDISKPGLDLINRLGKKYDMDIDGYLADMFDYPIIEEVDIVLLDDVLELTHKNIVKETLFVKRIADEIKVNGVIALFTKENSGKEKTVKDIFISNDNINWEILLDSYTSDYEDDKTYHMFIVRKK